MPDNYGEIYGRDHIMVPVKTWSRGAAGAAEEVACIGFARTDAAARDWNAYRQYESGEVMRTFARAFGLAELPAECRGAPS